MPPSSPPNFRQQYDLAVPRPRSEYLSIEAMVDNLSSHLRYTAQHARQAFDFIRGIKKPTEFSFVIKVSDLDENLLLNIDDLTEEWQGYVFTQAVIRLFEDVYFKHHFNPAYNFTRNSYSWSSFLLCSCDCLIPDVELT